MSLVLSLRSAALSFLCCCLLSPFAGGLVSADSHIQVPLSASGHVFVVNVTVGTPPQPLSLLVSPSSPDTWVPQADSSPCTNNFDSLAGSVQATDGSDGSACAWGVFNPSTSSTYRLAEQNFVGFSVAYSDTITVGGLNMTDTLTLGHVKLDALPMGIVTSASNNQYIGRLGLNNDASTLYPRASSKYRPNLIDQLVASGKISTQAYSIWLDDADGRSGALLLGAVDKSRYQGDLTRLKTIQPYDMFPSALAVLLNGVEISGGKEGFKYDGAPVAVTLSPAETFSYLPDALADSIIAAAGATLDSTLKRVTIPCDAASKTSTLNQISLKLRLQGPDGPSLEVRIADLVVPQQVTKWEIAVDSLPQKLDKNICLFGIQKRTFLGTSNSNPQFNIGSSLLRRTYMVFDNVNKDIAVAPVSSSAKSATAIIVPFAKAGARIPSSKLYCLPDANQSSSCLEEAASDPDPDSASSGGGASSTNSEPSSSNKTAIIVGVVVPVVLIAILAPLGYLFFVRRRKRNRQRQAEALREAQWERARQAAASGSRSDGSMLHDDDEPDNFAEDEFGVKVTVSVSSKVSVMKQTPTPSPIRPDFGLGLPGGFNSASSITPITEEKSDGHSSKESGKKSQYWGDAVLRAGGGGTGGASDGNLSARSASR